MHKVEMCITLPPAEGWDGHIRQCERSKSSHTDFQLTATPTIPESGHYLTSPQPTCGKITRLTWAESQMSAPQLQITWDVAKAQGNLAKHGVTFAQAATVLLDPLMLTVFDAAHSETEERWFTLGT
jgi:hypothetical protein